MQLGVDRPGNVVRNQRRVPNDDCGKVVAQCSGFLRFPEEEQRPVDVLPRVRCSHRHPVYSRDPLLLVDRKTTGRWRFEDTDDFLAHEYGIVMLDTTGLPPAASRQSQMSTVPSWSSATSMVTKLSQPD